MAGFASKPVARVPRGMHPVAHSPLKWLGSVLTGWFPLSQLLQRGPGNLPVMWDSYISGLDQVDSFSSISTTPVPPVINQQNQLKAGNCSAPYLWEDKWEADSCVRSCCQSTALGVYRPFLSCGIMSMQEVWQELGLDLHPVHAQNKSPEHRTLLHIHLWQTLVCCSSTPKCSCFQGLYFLN